MSRHLQACLRSFVVLAAVSISPAYGDPLIDFLGLNAASQDAVASTATQPQCLALPGSPTEGLRWVYRRDGHRKCWFQTDEQSAKKQVRRRIAKPLVGIPAESERKRKAVVDARAELIRSAAVETPPQLRAGPEINTVDDAPFKAIDPPSKEQPTIQQPAVVPYVGQQVVLETLPADAPSATDEVPGSAAKPKPATFPVAAQVDDEQGRMATSLGVLLMALGLICLLASGRSLRADLPPR